MHAFIGIMGTIAFIFVWTLVMWGVALAAQTPEDLEEVDE